MENNPYRNNGVNDILGFGNHHHPRYHHYEELERYYNRPNLRPPTWDNREAPALVPPRPPSPQLPIPVGEEDLSGRSAKRVKIEEDKLGENLHKDDGTKDFTIVGGGARVKCHKLVLKARSNWFATMLKNGHYSETKSGELKLEGMTEWGVNQLVRFLYGMEIPADELTPDYAQEMLQNGHAYELPELVQNIAEFLLEMDKEWFEKEEDADALLEMYFFTKVADANELLQKLNNHLLKVMSGLPSKNISNSSRFEELSKEESVKLLCSMHDVQVGRD